jgi:hypothetical protein
MRKLAREATIFALLGFLVAMVGCFVILEKDSKATAKLEAARAVHAAIPEQLNPSQISRLPPGAVVVPINSVAVPLTNGTVLHVRQCESSPPRRFVPLDSPDCRYFYDPFGNVGGRLVALPLGDKQQIALEKEYWIAYSESKRQSLVGSGLKSLVLGLWGFAAGIALWLFYRLVRFAIKG